MKRKKARNDLGHGYSWHRTRQGEVMLQRESRGKKTDLWPVEDKYGDPRLPGADTIRDLGMRDLRRRSERRIMQDVKKETKSQTRPNNDAEMHDIVREMAHQICHRGCSVSVPAVPWHK